ncbi:NADP-dependent malic enzyme [Lujinxingia litoralis]|uniref:NADP-dependent malic enzyme n=1 Tax=Lujinxingia litoralis TaxID=2211119 RepID=A0A328CD26_9DELT|nr:NADP-dependent malic enzyme [Lujinxingia litoralis]RAL25221.1 NADP-dependent malic enzyme [Lujinxingia litoralis]
MTVNSKHNGPIRRKDALDYHEFPRPGKIEVLPTKPLSTQRDLGLAYSPGVAEPCREIAADPQAAFRYTNRKNLVGIITNGTATLGLGDIGALASKPVMEGKAVLFKVLANIDAFDIELDERDPEAFARCVKALEPTFGGINLEDIAAPHCFEIEETLREALDIPVFHDDQHGTAIITGAALINALALQNKDIDDIKVVFVGAGAGAVACARLYESLGVRHENITMVDIHGIIYQGRDIEMDRYKGYFAQDTDKRTLSQALEGADVFVGLSAGGIVSGEMVKSMAPRPIIFALANPDPEIAYPDVMAVRDDVVMATGRSDYPNQVNNVLGFPFIFRGALDVGARRITESMKLAAVHALAALAREEVPEVVSEAYDQSHIRFGPDYIIPKPFDPRVLLRVAPAIAEAAMAEGVAREELHLPTYVEELERLQGVSKGLMRRLINVARRDPKRIVFPEGSEDKIIKAAQILVDEGIASPILLGDVEQIEARARALDIDLTGIELLDNERDPRFEDLAQVYYRMRQRKGVTIADARNHLRSPEPYAMMLVHEGLADGVVSGVTRPYRESLKPALQIIGVNHKQSRVAGMHVVVSRRGVKLFADTTVNIDPDAETLAGIAIATADTARMFDLEPRVAMLSYTNFGASRHPHATRVAEATRLVKERRPDLNIDGEMQLEFATDPDLRDEKFAFSTLEGDANVLIFPDLNASNIGYKLLHQLGGAEVIGPILLGMRRPVNVLQLACSVPSIVHLTVITCLHAQQLEREQAAT